mmetsp:Transcript_14828/g.21169  ORF Transcript_14828/g.21169 Transcript_14828/m.21169 type:complete len:208 (-) Transcript_14828:266-889(-)
MHFSFIHKGAQMMFDCLLLYMDAIDFIKLMNIPSGAQSIQVFFGTIPFGQIFVGIHMSDSNDSIQGTTFHAWITIFVFPKHFNFISFLFIFSRCIHVKAHRIFRSIVIIPIGKATQSNINFFALKDHGQVLIVGDIDNKVSPSKRKSCSPIGCQLWCPFNKRFILRLLTIAKILPWKCTFKVCIAHDGPLKVHRHVCNGVNIILQIT